jgi:hypothetical protein
MRVEEEGPERDAEGEEIDGVGYGLGLVGGKPNLSEAGYGPVLLTAGYGPEPTTGKMLTQSPS